MTYGLRRCARCGAIIYEDDSDYEEEVDLPEFCDLCNDEVRDTWGFDG
jgi:NAD-dependent SIR2 family protein deacetylase